MELSRVGLSLQCCTGGLIKDMICFSDSAVIRRPGTDAEYVRANKQPWVPAQLSTVCLHGRRPGLAPLPLTPSALSLDIPCDTRSDSRNSLCSCSRGFSSRGLLKDLSASNRQAEESPWERRRLV